MKYQSLTLVLAGIVTVGIVSYLPSRSTQPAKIQPITVETTRVIEKLFADQFETLGSLASMDHINITSEIAGQIAEIHFKPGTFVKKGTLLIQLDNAVLKSEVDSAHASLVLALNNFKRTQELTKRNITSAQALDSAQADLEEKQNMHRKKLALLEKLSLRAPFAGILGSKQVSAGQYVTMGQPLVSLIANQQMRVEYNMPERLLSRLHKGQMIQVLSEAFPSNVYRGTVNYIAPAIDKDTRTLAVEALIDNSRNQLYSGLFVRVQHQLGQPRKRLLVPEESLIPTISGQKIFIVRDNKAVAVNVKTGAHHIALTEIRQGLKLDDTIIVRGQHKLKEGSEISVKKQNTQ